MAFLVGFHDLYINQYGYLSSKYFDRLGFQNYIDAKKANEFYLLKYVGKSLESMNSYKKKRFFHSNNLNKPVVEKMLDKDDSFYLLPYTYKSSYVNMVTFKK